EREQESKSLQVVREAEAAKHEKLALAKARQAVFNARYQARTQLSLADEWSLLLAALNAAVGGQKPEDAERDYLRNRDEALQRQAALTDFRLYWETLSAALSGRDKVIIDAENVPGR